MLKIVIFLQKKKKDDGDDDDDEEEERKENWNEIKQKRNEIFISFLKTIKKENNLNDF